MDVRDFSAASHVDGSGFNEQKGRMIYVTG